MTTLWEIVPEQENNDTDEGNEDENDDKDEGSEDESDDKDEGSEEGNDDKDEGRDEGNDDKDEGCEEGNEDDYSEEYDLTNLSDKNITVDLNEGVRNILVNLTNKYQYARLHIAFQD